MMRHKLLIIFIWLPLLHVTAQSYFPRHHQLESSYQEARIHLSFECSNGLLLFGSDQGLLAYDGLSFTQIESPDPHRLNKVTAIHEDAQNNIWVGYDSGAIMKMPALTRKLEAWIIEEGWPASDITGFAFDHLNQLWFGTYGEGVYCYRNGRLYNFDEDDGLPAQDVYTIMSDDRGQIVVGTDGGVSICGWQDQKKSVVNFGTQDGLPDIIVRSLSLDQAGRCWAGTYEGGPALLDLEQKKIILPSANWPGGTISSLETGPDGSLWIGTETNGILQLKTLQDSYEKSIPAGKVYDLRIDQEGNLWSMDSRNGLTSYNLQFRYLYPGISGIQTVLPDQDGGLWLGTEQGLYYAPSTDSTYVFTAWPTANWNIISLFEDGDQNIWIGTFGSGLHLLHPPTKALYSFTEANGLQNANILSIYGDGRDIWLGTLGGAYHLPLASPKNQYSTWQFASGQSVPSSLASYIYSVQKDRSGRVWLGTDGDGLSFWDNGRVQQFTDQSALLEESVYSLAPSETGHLLFNSSLGLFRLGQDSLQGSYLPIHLLPSEVSAIWPGPDRDIFIIHKEGISTWYDRDSSFTHYSDAVGLEKFAPVLNGIAQKDRDIVIAANDYLVFLNADFPVQRTQAKPLLTRIDASLENIPLNNTQALPARQNSLAFEINGLWYTDPTAIRYQYRMIGFDQDWIRTVDQRIVYSKLPPGEYTFEVAASANGDFSQALVDKFQFRLRAPLWQRTWFILLLILVIMSLLYQFIRQREARLERTASLERDSVESKYETLKSQINPHFLFNSFNTLVAIIEEEPKQAVTYVEKLTDFYRSILQYRERDLIPLREELQIVSNYLFLLKERFGENLSMHLPKNGEEYLVAPLSLQILCENAVKHNVISRNQPFTIDISKDDREYLWVVNKLQKKLGNEKSTGTGLQNITSRYALLTKRPIIIEETDEYFRVGVPLISMFDV